jgi:glycosyltransferase involved in cell wall biosynthesis
MKIAMLVPDNRDELRRYSDPEPYFGPAPSALLEGLMECPEIEIHIVCCTQRPLRAPARLAGNIFYHSLLVPKWGWLRGGYLGCVRAVRRKLRQINPDIVHGQGTERYCALAAVCSGFPNVLTIHGNMRRLAGVNRARPFSFLWLAARLEGFTLPRSGGVICLSGHTKGQVAGLAPLSWVVPNAVDSRFFEVERKPASPRQILCVASITPSKNQVQLIRALDPLARQEKFDLIFYGSSVCEVQYVQEFLRLVQERAWCRFEGLADRAGVQAALARAALLVLPTLEDNCPMVILEAMAAGVPVAAAKVGGLPDLITDGVDGVLFDLDPSENIGRAVSEILLDDKKASQLASAARSKALASFHPRKIAGRHLEIYREIVRGCRGSG